MGQIILNAEFIMLSEDIFPESDSLCVKSLKVSLFVYSVYFLYIHYLIICLRYLYSITYYIGIKSPYNYLFISVNIRTIIINLNFDMKVNIKIFLFRLFQAINLMN